VCGTPSERERTQGRRLELAAARPKAAPALFGNTRGLRAHGPLEAQTHPADARPAGVGHARRGRRRRRARTWQAAASFHCGAADTRARPAAIFLTLTLTLTLYRRPPGNVRLCHTRAELAALGHGPKLVLATLGLCHTRARPAVVP
jgi:hypothetical protein